MKKLLMALTLGLVFTGLVGCKEETPAQKIEDGTVGLEQEAKEKADEIMKKTPEVPAKPKDHPAH